MAGAEFFNPAYLELAQLRKRLAEAEDALQDVHLDETDAPSVEDANRPRAPMLPTEDDAYRALVQSMSEGVASISDTEIVLFCNQGLANLVGRTPQEIVGSFAALLAMPGDRERLHELILRGFEGACQAEIHFQHADRAVPVKVSLNKIPGAKIRSLSLLATDLSELRKAEERMQWQAGIVELAHDAMFLRDCDGSILSWNRGAKELYGWSAEEAIGKNTDELLHTDYAVPVDEVYTTLRAAREWEGELTQTCRSGNQVIVASRWSILHDPASGAESILEVNRDITDRKRAEGVLRLAARYVRCLIEASIDPLVTIDREGKVTDVNQAAENLTGVSRQQLIGSDFLIYFTDPDQARKGYERVFVEGIVRDYPLVIRDASGKLTELLCNASIFRNDQGEVQGVLAAARDVTEVKKIETQLRTLNEDLEERVSLRTRDLNAVNQELEAFNYAVAHDLRAPLRHIRGFSQLLLEEAGTDLSETAKRYLSIIGDSVVSMGQLIDDLLNLSRLWRQEICKETCGLRSIFDEVFHDLQPQMEGRNIVWSISDLPFVDCDPNLMKQVLINLLSNAIKFTRDRDPARIDIGHIAIANQSVVFIRDNGVGFEMKYAGKLFGLFQRLHRQEDFPGSGVGLAIVQRVMQRHGGAVWVEAALNKGATFYLSFNSIPSEIFRNQVAELTTPAWRLN